MASLRLCIVLLVMVSPGDPISVPTCDPCDASVHTVNCSNRGPYFRSTPVPGITCDTSHVQVLDVSRNNLVALQRGAFQNLMTLQELLLHHARVRAVDKDAFHSLKELRKLDLSFNNIGRLDSETFQGLESLQELYLGQNPLKVLANSIFSGLKGLTTLDLRGCELTLVSGESFRGGVGMKSTPLDEGASAWPSGLHLDVRDNPLNCDCALGDLHDLAVHSRQHDNVTCAQPPHLRGYPLHVLDSADLNCKPYEILFPLRNRMFSATRGRNVTLSCRIANDPHLPWRKRWTFNAGESIVSHSSPRFVISSTNLWLNLTIEGVIPSDEGIYKCEVYNHAKRLTTYRNVFLVVEEEVKYFTDMHMVEHINMMYLIFSLAVSATFIFVVTVLVGFRRKPDVCAKKRKAAKRSRDFMISVPFYATADNLVPTRPLPLRPGSVVLPWWLENPEHLYEEVDSNHSLDHPTKHTARPR